MILSQILLYESGFSAYFCPGKNVQQDVHCKNDQKWYCSKNEVPYVSVHSIKEAAGIKEILIIFKYQAYSYVRESRDIFYLYLDSTNRKTSYCSYARPAQPGPLR